MSTPTIYFVQTNPPDGPVKIGFTGRKVKVRMAEGQTFAHQDLHLLVETYGTLADEALLHRIFKRDHVRGEWFLPSPFLWELIHHLADDNGNLQTWLESVTA